MAAEGGGFRYIAHRRRAKEHRRFLAGAGRFAADYALPGMLHVALVASPYPMARIKRIDAAAALAVSGVRAVVAGDDIARATDAMMSGLDLPKMLRYPLAVGTARYVGEWVAAVVAESRAVAEDAAELVEVAYEPLTPVVDPEAALAADAALVHPALGTNVLYRRQFVWGPVEADFAASPGASPIARAGTAAPPCRSRRSACLPNGTRRRGSSISGPRSRCRNFPSSSPARCACRGMRCARISMSMLAAAMAASAG